LYEPSFSIRICEFRRRKNGGAVIDEEDSKEEGEEVQEASE